MQRIQINLPPYVFFDELILLLVPAYFGLHYVNCRPPTKSLLQCFMTFMQIFNVNGHIFFSLCLVYFLLSCIMWSLKMNSQNKNILYWKQYLKINGVLVKHYFP